MSNKNLLTSRVPIANCLEQYLQCSLNFDYLFSAWAEPAELLKMPLAYWPAVFESWGHQFFKSMKMLWRLSRQLLCSTTTSSRPKAPTTSAPPIWGVKLKMVNYFQASKSVKPWDVGREPIRDCGCKSPARQNCQRIHHWQSCTLAVSQCPSKPVMSKSSKLC